MPLGLCAVLSLVLWSVLWSVFSPTSFIRFYGTETSITGSIAGVVVRVTPTTGNISLKSRYPLVGVLTNQLDGKVISPTTRVYGTLITPTTG